MTKPLTRAILHDALHQLAARERRFGDILDAYGPPPLWARKPGFATLVLLILEQQVSIASARATFARLQEAAGETVPDALLAMSDAAMNAVGVSRQKIRYIRELSIACKEGRLDLKALNRAPDHEVERALIALPGIGPWTAQVYLAMALRRPDVFAAGDLALQIVVHERWRLRSRPNPERLLKIAEPWRPLRGAAMRLLWHAYLTERRAGK